MRPALNRVPGKLLALSLLLAVLPLGALAWLGWQLLQQDRALETQRRQELLAYEANVLADSLAKEILASSPDFPPVTTWLRFGEHGVVRRGGDPLLYYPAVAPPKSVSAQVFAAADAAELDPATAPQSLSFYRSLGSSPEDPSLRAEALMRWARMLRTHGKAGEALAVYQDLAALGATLVLGDPAELVARRQRALLFDASGDAKAAASERELLAKALTAGRYTLDRATYDFYSEDLPAPPAIHAAFTTDLEHWWPRWHAEPSGRATWIVNNTAFATVWMPSPEGTAAAISSVEVGDAAAQESAYRRKLQIAGFGLMTTIILSAAFFVFRALEREWRVARLRSDFVAHVSHEFRSPLTAMRHLTELLEEGGTPSERLPHYYQALGRETHRLLALVENLLDFGRMDSGRHTYRLEDLQVEEVAERVVEEFASPRLKLQSASTVPIRADRAALALAVRNLIDNAMKYSPASTDVSISIQSTAGENGISVLDHGVGISPEEKRDILGAFVRGSAAQAMNVKGTGIGLAMVDQVAKAHGGRVELESRPGGGSRFTLWIPKAVA